MHEYRTIETRVWKDRRFRDLTADAKLLFLWAVASGKTYKTAFAAFFDEIMYETSIDDVHRVSAAIGLLVTRDLIAYDERIGVMALTSGPKYDVVLSSKNSKHYISYIDSLFGADTPEIHDGSITDLTQICAGSGCDLKIKVAKNILTCFCAAKNRAAPVREMVFAYARKVCESAGFDVNAIYSGSDSDLRAMPIKLLTINKDLLSSSRETREQLTLDSCETGSRDKQSDKIRLVSEHYISLHPRAKVGEKEQRLIKARLADGFSAVDLKRAIDGCHASPWHCGENPDRRKYQSLQLILRDASKVSDFIEISQRNVTSSSSEQDFEQAEAEL